MYITDRKKFQEGSQVNIGPFFLTQDSVHSFSHFVRSNSFWVFFFFFYRKEVKRDLGSLGEFCAEIFAMPCAHS